jgi:hypothetical protein
MPVDRVAGPSVWDNLINPEFISSAKKKPDHYRIVREEAANY